VFGSPEDTNWAWMLTGHHMSAIFTVAGDRTTFMPTFTGAQPLHLPSGLEAGWQVLPQDAGRAGELLSALSSDQQQLAIIGASAPGDVLAGPGRQASLSRVAHSTRRPARTAHHGPKMQPRLRLHVFYSPP
jgi:Protein of unknown function (DUF3500)